MDYTAVGDTTNLAARFQSIANAGGILISDNTHRLVDAYFELKPLGPLQIKGKKEPQKAWVLIKSNEVASRFEASVSAGLVRFVGRTDSKAVLQDAWQKAKSGAGQVVGIYGEAGVGKSRLLLEFRNSLAVDQFTYLEGRCLHFSGITVYLPFLDILRSYFGIEEGEKEYVIQRNLRNKLSELDDKLHPATLHAFEDMMSIKVEDDVWLNLEPKERRERTFDALLNLIIRVSRRKPLVMAVEDLHWVDKTSEDFISYLITMLPQNSILLVLLYRPEFKHQWGAKPFYRHIGLDQLSSSASAELLMAILSDCEVDHELENFILDRASGNPLFTEELTRDLKEARIIQLKNNRRRKFHEIIGEAIEEIYAGRLEEFYDRLAYHYSKSDNLDKAYTYAKFAADKASANHSVWEALEYYKQTIDILDRLSDDQENKKRKLEILNSMTVLLRLLGYPENSIKFLQLGKKLAHELGAEANLANFYSLIGHYQAIDGKLDSALKYQENCFQKAIVADDLELMAQSAYDLCTSYGFVGEWRKIAEKAMISSQKNGEKLLEGASWMLLGKLLGLSNSSSIDTAEENFHKGIKILEVIKIKPLTGGSSQDRLAAITEFPKSAGLIYQLDGRYVQRILEFDECG